VESCLARYGLEGKIIATCNGEALAGVNFHHPMSSTDAGYARLSPVYLGEYVTKDAGTGIVHSAPAYGVEDYASCKAHGMRDDAIINPVMGDGRFASTLPLFGGMTIWEASKPICSVLENSGTLFKLVMFDHLYALLAPQNPHHLSRNFTVVCEYGPHTEGWQRFLARHSTEGCGCNPLLS